MKNKKILIAAVIAFIGVGVFTYFAGSGTEDAFEGAPGISADKAILIDGDSGEIIYEKNADEKAYPASTTKIMTALVVLEVLEENKSPINQKIKVPRVAEGVEGSSIYLKEGEMISIEDLLYGLMLVSGNDSAVALAEIIGGDEKNFVKMMNKKARELGCKGTHFSNPNGLFDENHYTTAADMAKISREAMKKPVFRKIVKTEVWVADRKENTYETFCNKNKTIYQYKGGNGIKIGYTQNSGRTLVASSTRNGKSLICVVMNAPDWFNDAYKLMDLGFSD